MAIRRLSGECEDADWSCPSIWEDDELPEDVIVVGPLSKSSPVPLGPGEGAILLSRRVVRDARIG